MTETKNSVTEIRRRVKYGSHTIPLILQHPHKTFENSCGNALQKEILTILGKELSQFLPSEEPDLTPSPQPIMGKAVP